ncbi:DNA ligase 4 [Sitophilus oryzae]|uniref:DNA ligase 4 n=1 Tax=Sitophilus oryzae TaxID=7048 RepID=A0A6J2YTW8_SITOR|nr:DNA ligase 4 [Sitophilus oryzae]
MNNLKDFENLCKFLNSVREADKPNNKTSIIKDYFDQWRECQPKEAMFSLLRLIVPKLDRARESYGLKEAKIARILIKMLALPTGHDRNVLSKSYLMSGQASDFGDVVYSVIRKYLANKKTVLTIDELNLSLDSIANRNNESEAEDVLIKLFKKCACEDSRWIIRIILKDLKLGISETRILNCYHHDAAQFYSSNHSLEKVTHVLYDKNINICELDIAIFEAFRPMLSKRVNHSSFKKDFQENKLYYVENKFDGERFQIHMDNKIFKYFSRNGYDYTDTFGPSYESGILTPKFKNLFKESTNNIILDGEMMLWNTITKKYGSKGMEFDVKRLKESGKLQPCYCVYDIILLNNRVLTGKPLRERVALLRQIFTKTIPGIVVLSEITEVHSCQEIVDELNSAVAREDEGIVVKDPESFYKYGDRNSGWFKIKLEYFQDTMTDLDLILMGAQYASSTSDELNSFVVGIRSGNTENGDPIYLSFGKVAIGLNYDQLDMLNKRIKELGRQYKNDKKPYLLFGKEIPNYYIEPKDSLIFVVRATELIKNTDNSYRTQYTFRFPRIVRIREDKPVSECLNINELMELTQRNNSVIKLNKSRLELDELIKVKRRNTKKKEIFVPVIGDTRQVSDILEDLKIYVLNGNEEKSKDDLEILVSRAGGTICYKIDATVDIVLVGTINDKVKELFTKRNNYDVINVKWLYRTLADGNVLGYETLEIYCLGTNPKNCLSDEVDRYGDSYTEEATIETLKHSFDVMGNLQEVPSFGGLIEVPGSKTFDMYKAYFDKFTEINNVSSDIIYDSFFDELEFKYYNGDVCQTVGNETNIIVFYENERIAVINNFLSSIDRLDIEVKSREFIYNK